MRVSTRIALALALALCLCLAAATATAAEKINTTLLPRQPDEYDESLNVQNVAAVGDTLYILTDTALYDWTPGMDEPRMLASGLFSRVYSIEAMPEGATAISELFSMDGALYGVFRGNGTVLRLINDAGEYAPTPVCTLDISFMHFKGDGYVDYGSFDSIAAQDGVLYALGYVNDGAEFVSQSLMQFDLATGKLIKREQDEGLLCLSAFKDGMLLTIREHEDGAYDESSGEQRPSQLWAENFTTGDKASLGSLIGSRDCGLCYSPDAQTIYFTSGAKVYAVPDITEDPRIAAYLPEPIWTSTSCCLLSSGMFVYGNYNGVFVRGLDMPSLAEGAVLIYGEYGTQQHMAAINALPDITFTSSTEWLDGIEQLTNAMVSGENSADIMRLDAQNSPVKRLIQKGYALALNDYPAIMEIASRMDPVMLEPYTVDGKLYAVPVSASAQAYACNLETCEELGLAKDDLPTSFEELMDFLSNYYYDYGEEHQEINLFDEPGFSIPLLYTYVDQYINVMTKREGKVAFDTPEFRNFLNLYESTDFTEIDPYKLYGDSFWSDQEAQEEFWEKQNLFLSYFDISGPEPLNAQSGVAILPLSLGANDEPFFSVRNNVLIINPKSEHKDSAAAYVAEYIKNLDKYSAMYTLFPDNNEPLPNANYDRDKANLQKYLDDLMKQLETAPEESKASIRNDIEFAQKELDEFEKYRYDITEEQVKLYRETIAPYMFPVQQSPLTDYTGNGNEFYSLIQQYVAGAIDMEQFVREMDNRMRMMMLEDM